MPTYTFSGVNVEFPYEAYDVQAAYMRTVIDALQACSNALLESPTGTGKTLCLLCATLAWRQALVEGRVRPLHAMNPTADPAGAPRGPELPEPADVGARAAAPRIVYASRTHSQLAQVVAELRRTAYRPKMVVFGSREQSCIHPEVSELRGLALTHACQTLTKADGCKFNNNLVRQKLTAGGVPVHPGVLDIEEFASLCRTKELCPFYYARELQADAELLFVPYNYLIDPKSRRALGLSGARDVLIFDEAHNIEKVCTEAASLELSATTLAAAIAEVDRCVKVAAAGGAAADELSAAAADSAAVVGFRGGAAGGAAATASGGAADPSAVSVGLLAQLKDVLLALERSIDALPLGRDGSLTRPGDALRELLGGVRVTAGTSDELVGVMQRAANMLAGALQHAGGVKTSALHALAELVGTLFEPGHDAADFRMHVAVAKGGEGGKGRGGGPQQGGASGRVLSYWCLNPAVAMLGLLRANHVHSLLLTSGTLSPLASFARELQLPFPLRLENEHVIEGAQCAVCVVKKGPTGVPLNSSFQNRDSPAYLAELGRTVVNVARLVPDGVLVFFPSYALLDATVAFWQRPQPATATEPAAASTWQRLLRFKLVVVEPRGGQGSLAAALAEFEAALAAGRGAVFLGVCRGKLSEGIDFADRAGRAVVITGLPLPPWKDPQVELKRAYLDARAQAERASAGRAQGAGRGAAGGAKGGDEPLTGDAWYMQQGMRAINQAVGRVIRHRHDYGAVLLCDERFEQPRYRQALSLWLRPRVAVCESFGQVHAQLTAFFKEQKANEARRPAPRARDADAAAAAGGGGAGDEAADGGEREGGARRPAQGGGGTGVRTARPLGALGLTAQEARSVSERDYHHGGVTSLAAQLARGGGAGARLPPPPPARTLAEVLATADGAGSGGGGACARACSGFGYLASRKAQLAKQAEAASAQLVQHGKASTPAAAAAAGASIAERLGGAAALGADRAGAALALESHRPAAAPAAAGQGEAQPSKAALAEARAELSPCEYAQLLRLLARAAKAQPQLGAGASASAGSGGGGGGDTAEGALGLASELRALFAADDRPALLERLRAHLPAPLCAALAPAPAVAVPAAAAAAASHPSIGTAAPMARSLAAPAGAPLVPREQTSQEAFLARAKAALAEGYPAFKKGLVLLMQLGKHGDADEAATRAQLAALNGSLAGAAGLQAELARVVPKRVRALLGEVQAKAAAQAAADRAPGALAAAGWRRPRPTLEYEQPAAEPRPPSAVPIAAGKRPAVTPSQQLASRPRPSN